MCLSSHFRFLGTAAGCGECLTDLKEAETRIEMKKTKGDEGRVAEVVVVGDARAAPETWHSDMHLIFRTNIRTRDLGMY